MKQVSQITVQNTDTNTGENMFYGFLSDIILLFFSQWFIQFSEHVFICCWSNRYQLLSAFGWGAGARSWSESSVLQDELRPFDAGNPAPRWFMDTVLWWAHNVTCCSKTVTTCLDSYANIRGHISSLRTWAPGAEHGNKTITCHQTGD